MSDLSVRDFLQVTRNIDPSKGIRWLAPALKEISLRNLLQMERVIIHLSDFHIGLNDSLLPLNQAQHIINGIISAYPPNPHMPVVVITGDLVDHASHSIDIGEHYNDPLMELDATGDHVGAAAGLLQKLADAGFKVLAIPGNHDYSDLVDIDDPKETSWEENTLREGTKTLRQILDERADKAGYDHKLVSGVSYTDAAYEDFIGGKDGRRAMLRPFMENSLSPSYVFLDQWRDKGAAFDLHFIMLDSEDHHPTKVSSDLTWSWGIKEKFYLHDNTFNKKPVTKELDDRLKAGLRFGHGWLEDITRSDGLGTDEVGVNYFGQRVADARNQQALPIVATHYPINYTIGTYVPSTRQTLAILLTMFVNQYEQWPVSDIIASVGEKSFSDFLSNLLTAAMQLSVLPQDELASIVSSMNDRLNDMVCGIAVSVDKSTYGQEIASSYKTREPEERSATSLVNAMNLFDIIDNCHVLLFGDRHRHWGDDSPDKMPPRHFSTDSNPANNSYLPDPLESFFGFSQALAAQSNISNDDIVGFLKRMPGFDFFFSGFCASETLTNRASSLIGALADVAMNTDLNCRNDPLYGQLARKPHLALYSEAGATILPPVENQNGKNNWDDQDVLNTRLNWVELHINLQTGEVSAIPNACPSQ